MRTEAFASPLTVWVGPRHYTFPPGRDVIVGRDSRADVRLDSADPSTSPTHLVLHHDGRQWVAIDRSQRGIYVDGVRMSTVFIRDGRSIILGDPRRGLRLVFQLSGPTAPPGQPGVPPPGARPGPPPPPPGQRPARLSQPNRNPPRFGAPPRSNRPSQLPTRPFRLPRPAAQPSRSTAPGLPSQLPTQQFRTPPPPPPQPEPLPPQPKPAKPRRAGLVERVTCAMQRLIPRRPHGEAPTGPLPRAEVSTEHPPQLPLGALEADQLGLSVDGQPVLAGVSFTAQPGTLTAVIGPSKAARTALVNIVGGTLRPGSGNVTIGGHDPHTTEARRHVGMVPADDLLHPQLTIEQALGYLAELRLPPNTSADNRRQVVDQVIDELELTPLRTVQVGTLSREQRKRASVAAELITGPSLLVLDEPTNGLDPALQRQTMATLRRLADAGRVVVVSTTAVDHLDECDQVLMLTSTGEVEVARQARPEQGLTAAVAPLGRPARPGLLRQIAVVTRRQAWLLVGDQRYFAFLTLLPLLFAGLVLVVPGHAGLGKADPYGSSPEEALEILAMLNFGAVVTGTVLTIRDVFKERFIFRREQADGLSTAAYLAAKIAIYSLVALVWSAIITTVAVVGKGAAGRGAVVLGSAPLKLYLAVVVTIVVSAIVALALSSLARYAEQFVLMAVLVILASVLFSGGAFPLAGRFGLEQLSWLLPARWGFAASASSVDLHAINSLAVYDPSWSHSTRWWVVDMALLLAIGVVCTAFLQWRLRRIREPEHVA